MKTKVPAVLALYVVSQCAPLHEVLADDKDDMTSLYVTDSVTLGNPEDSYDEEAVLERLDESKQKYLNADTGLLVMPQMLSATTDDLHKRDAVNVLEVKDGYAWILDDEGNTGWVSSDLLKDSRDEIFDETEQVMYAVDAADVYAEPSEDAEVITEFKQNDEVNVTGLSETYTRVDVNGTAGYVLKDSLQDHKLTFSERLKTIQNEPVIYTWNGAVLSTSKGSVNGPSGKETYYNLDMSTVIRVMRSMGFSEAEYPYWVRKDGAKMLGPYVMVAANLGTHPKGSVMDISLGKALVCDTGEFAYNGSGTSVDVAVTW